jgi:ABC-2 type transport system ATP-binding protein
MPYNKAAIDVSQLTKRYGDVSAVADLTLRVERGAIFGFLGPNGAGKTTAVKILLGLIRASSGDGYVLGAPLGDRHVRRRVGYLPELFRYPEWLSGREVLEFHAALTAIPRRERWRRIGGVLEAVDLLGRRDDRVATYSKGMQQRLGLAVALLADPDLVFLDEPTSALDPIGRRDVREILRHLRANGTTIFLNSHLLTEVEQVCDRVAIVQSGRIIAEGALHEIAGIQRGVRIRAISDGAPLCHVLERFGEVQEEATGAFVRGVAHDRIPEVVAALVAEGARVYGIEAVLQTLEERFLEMVATQ